MPFDPQTLDHELSQQVTGSTEGERLDLYIALVDILLMVADLVGATYPDLCTSLQVRHRIGLETGHFPYERARNEASDPASSARLN